MYMADGHPSPKCTHVLCETDAHDADKGFNVCGPQWQGLSALSARLAALQLRSVVAHTSHDCDIRRSSTSLFKAEGTNQCAISG